MTSKKSRTSAITTEARVVLGRASQVFDSVDDACIDPKNSSLGSYISLRRYFTAGPKLDADDFICAAHLVYRWMPTILSIGDAKPDELAALLDIARHAGKLKDEQLKVLAAAVNNSLVGASKLLYFAAPDSFTIWDSRIHRFVFQQEPHHYRINDINRYRTYMGVLRELERSH